MTTLQSSMKKHLLDEAAINSNSHSRYSVAINNSDNNDSNKLETLSTNECCDDVQEEGPTEADVSSVRSIEQRNWENLQQENTYWQDMLTSTYMSRSYQMVNTVSDVSFPSLT